MSSENNDPTVGQQPTGESDEKPLEDPQADCDFGPSTNAVEVVLDSPLSDEVNVPLFDSAFDGSGMAFAAMTDREVESFLYGAKSVRHVFISVTEKRNPDIAELVLELARLGNWRVIGSAGTCKYLAEHGIKAQDVGDMIAHSIVKQVTGVGLLLLDEQTRKPVELSEAVKRLNAKPMLGHRVVILSREKSAS